MVKPSYGSRAFEPLLLAQKQCFVCAKRFKTKPTNEDVFPKWLQSRYRLFNRPLKLLNDTKISFRQLLVPCCQPCNNEYLSRLEEQVSSGHDAGYEQFAEIDERSLHQWLCKLFYGNLLRQLTLLRNRAERRRGTIITKRMLSDFSLMRFFLRSLKRPVEYPAGYPWSMFVVRTQKWNDPVDDFGYYDNPRLAVCAIRMGEVGVIACLDDGGAQQRAFHHEFEGILDVSLHPMQFNELIALTVYRAMRMQRPTFVITERLKKPAALLFAVPRLSATPVFEPFVASEFAEVLTSLWKPWSARIDDLFAAPDRVVTSLKLPDSKPVRILPRTEPILRHLALDYIPDDSLT